MFAAALPAAIAAAGTWFGSQSTNRANINIARDTNAANFNIAQMSNDFSARQAAEQMAFQERMSGSAWQRGVADMRKAGINPMLAFSQGGASSPSGSAATAQQIAMQQPPSQLNSIGSSISSALDVLRLQADLKNAAAQNENIISHSNLNRAQATKVLADANLSQAGLNKARTISNLWGIPQKVSKLGSGFISDHGVHTARSISNFFDKYGYDSPSGRRARSFVNSNPATRGMFGF